jgi:hypothetical protein
MPLLAYFAVAGSILVGLLFVAEAQLGPATSLNISTDFHGLPVPFKAEAAPILTARDAPAPDLPKTVAAQPSVSKPPPPPKMTTASARKTKKNQKTVRHKANRNLYAESSVRAEKSHRVW